MHSPAFAGPLSGGSTHVGARGTLDLSASIAHDKMFPHLSGENYRGLTTCGICPRLKQLTRVRGEVSDATGLGHDMADFFSLLCSTPIAGIGGRAVHKRAPVRLVRAKARDVARGMGSGSDDSCGRRGGPRIVASIARELQACRETARLAGPVHARQAGRCASNLAQYTQYCLWMPAQRVEPSAMHAICAIVG